MLKRAFLPSLVLLCTPSLANAGCPMINGVFTRIIKSGDNDVLQRRTHYTREDRNGFNYSIDRAGNFQLADGVARPIKIGDRTGKITVSCEGDSMVTKIVADDTGKVYTFRLTPLNNSELKVEDSIPGRNGIYVKQP